MGALTAHGASEALPSPSVAARELDAHRVWLFALGYFAAYVPYAALTRWLSQSIPPLELVAMLALLGQADLAAGFTHFWRRPEAPLGPMVGLLSEATGVFGALVLLDARENSFSVPLNRASSVLGGVGASGVLALASIAAAPSRAELLGAAVLVLAVAVLAFHPKRRAHLLER